MNHEELVDCVVAVALGEKKEKLSLGTYGPSSGHEGSMLELPFTDTTDSQLEDGTVRRFCLIN